MNPMTGKFTAKHDMEHGAIIAVYRVGYMERVPDDVQAAHARINAILERHKDDVALIRSWAGNVVIYDPMRREINPEITDAMMVQAKADALSRYPDYVFHSQWLNAQHGLDGISVRLHPKKERA